MDRKIELTVRRRIECPYSFDRVVKGWPSGMYECQKVYDKRPNFQGSYRQIGNQSQYRRGIPEWCPLPVVEPQLNLMDLVQEYLQNGDSAEFKALLERVAMELDLV